MHMVFFKKKVQIKKFSKMADEFNGKNLSIKTNILDCNKFFEPRNKKLSQ